LELLVNNKKISSISETSLDLAPNTTFEEWEAIGQDLHRIGRCWQWWVGDWLNFGESKYGEKYSQAIETTGINPQSLMDCSYVSRNVEISLRNEIVSWSHHKAVAPLNKQEQSNWLKNAEKDALSVSELREAIRDSKQISRRREIVVDDFGSEAVQDKGDSNLVQKPGRESTSPAQVVDTFYKAHFPPLVRGIDAAAIAIGGKGPNHKQANDALNSFSDAVKKMREGAK
jgi:hypothetical protein